MYETEEDYYEGMAQAIDFLSTDQEELESLDESHIKKPMLHDYYYLYMLNPRDF
jgi:hypothetical protein